MEKEGVIKFSLEFRQAGPTQADGLRELNAWREILFRLGLTGLDPCRYGGLAFGNVSLRTEGGQFAVSGTQTGGKPRLGAEDYCLVTGFDLAHNRIHAEGPVKPSSEALSHGAVYAANRDVECVLHVHSPVIWRNHEKLGIVATASDIPYGTPMMGIVVGLAAAAKPDGVIAMGGHEDGVLAFGPTPRQAALCLLTHLAKALEFDGASLP